MSRRYGLSNSPWFCSTRISPRRAHDWSLCITSRWLDWLLRTLLSSSISCSSVFHTTSDGPLILTVSKPCRTCIRWILTMRRSMQSQSRRDQLLDHHLLQHHYRCDHYLPAYNHGFSTANETQAEDRCGRNLRLGFLRRHR